VEAIGSCGNYRNDGAGAATGKTTLNSQNELAPGFKGPEYFVGEAAQPNLGLHEPDTSLALPLEHVEA
jgi:hypothetical protein